MTICTYQLKHYNETVYSHFCFSSSLNPSFIVVNHNCQSRIENRIKNIVKDIIFEDSIRKVIHWFYIERIKSWIIIDSWLVCLDNKNFAFSEEESILKEGKWFSDLKEKCLKNLRKYWIGNWVLEEQIVKIKKNELRMDEKRMNEILNQEILNWWNDK